MTELHPVHPNLILFDGTCIFCSRFARLIANRDKEQKFKFVTAHSEYGRRLYEMHDLDADLMETNIVIVDGKASIKIAAFASAMSAIGWPWKVLAIINLPPKFITNWIYDRIAKNRYKFGRQKCLLPSPELRARLIE